MYLIKLYNYGKYDDEIHSACYSRLIGACRYGIYKPDGTYIPPYYDDTRVNIATFVHSVVRNHIVSRLYRLKKFVDCFETTTSTITYDVLGDYDWENLFDYEDVKQSIFETAHLSAPVGDVVDFMDESDFDNPVKKVLLWQISKSNFLSAETR